MGLGSEGRQPLDLEGLGQVGEAREAQAGSTIAVMDPAQPGLRGSGP